MAEEPADRQSRLSASRRALLEKRVRDANRKASETPRIPPRSDAAAPVPLSSPQQRLWVLDQLVPGNSWYNVTRTAHVEGALDADALDRALQEVVSRHEALRTTFESRDERPVQLVSSGGSVRLNRVSVEADPPGEREARALEVAREDAERPFDLSRGPLLRALLVRISPDRHLLHFTAHHIVTDGWSMEVLFRDLSALYAAEASGTSPALDALPIQYPDYCLWQREWLESDAARAQVEHRAEALRGAPPLELPLDHARPVTPTFRGTLQTRLVSPEVLEKLRALARSEGATLFMGLLAAFEIFLHRHTGQDDLSVATPIAGRSLPELEGLIGFFANTVVIRADLSGDPTVREVLRRVRETAFDAYAHQDVPLEKLVEVLRPERSLSQNPIAQVVCVLQNAPSSELTLAGARVVPVDVLTQTARFDLELHARETAQGLSCTLIASSELFDGETVERLLDRFVVLLGSIVENADRPAATLDILPEAERARLLSDWNPASRDLSTGRRLHELFQERAAAAPDAVALEFEGARLSYGELNVRANRLAWRLTRMGVGPDVLVAVCLERSLEMVVALLGILKAGGAYVPLDPAYPAERLAFMLEDAQAPVLVTVESLVGSLPVRPGLQVCRLDRDAEPASREDDRDPPATGSPQDLAYVIYTSGSTGKPKGVLVTHQNVDRLFTATEDWFRFGERDVWTLFHSYAFDFSVWELWGALRYGGRLVIVSQTVARSPEAFLDLLSRTGVTVLNQTPSAFRQLVAADARSARPLTLRFVIFGGEALEPEMLRPWFAKHGDETPRLVNMYGITETTVHVTYHPVSRKDLDRPSRSVIGRQIPDLQLFVLDRALGLAPIGVPGELGVAGGGVARGYLRRPELTGERFIANPFGEGRLYRSGDLARYQADGSLEYLGRIDHQVKIRGHRIELGEIEAALGAYPGVRESVVVVRDEGEGDRRLVAYVVPRSKGSASIADLRSFLGARLPAYMVPAVYVELDRLPMTPSGKLDRRSLPQPQTARPDLPDAFVGPRSETERRIAEIWSQVLKVDRIGMHDNFFELGGDSILSIQITARANQAGLRLTPNQMFQHQTIAELAAVASEGPVARAEQGVVTGDVPFTPIQRWFLSGETASRHHYNQSLLFEVREKIEKAALEKAAAALFEHHDALRLRILGEGDRARQFFAPAEENDVLSWFDHSSLAPPRQDETFESEAAALQASLDLEKGPIARIALFDRGAARPAVLLAVVHHLAVDGVSWHILAQDLESAYRAAARGGAIELPPKTTSYREWARLLAGHAASASVARELGFWITQSEPGAPVPRDREAGPNSEASSKRFRVGLDRDETVALLQEVPAAYRTQINDVLLAALVRAFQGWTGEDSMRVHMEGHGREEIVPGVDLSRTVGWFTTIFPVRLEIGTEGWPGESLKRVKETLRAVPNKGIGYGLLRYGGGDSSAAARLADPPAPEVSFNYLGQFDSGLSGSDLLVPAEGSVGPIHAPAASRRHLLDVEAIVLQGSLRVDWTYSANFHEIATVERLAAGFLEALRSLISHCRSAAETEFTPSDFPLAALKQDRLDRILRKFGKE